MEVDKSLIEGKELDRRSREFLERIVGFCDAVESKKGLDVIALDMRGLSSELDAFIICHGTSPRHVRAISEAVDEKLREWGEKPLFVEGVDEASWILLDCVDVGVHIFQEKTREYYRLEELWSHAPVIDLGISGATSSGRALLK
jgi:ribosome-associated protein